jgi:hypothetical protein
MSKHPYPYIPTPNNCRFCGKDLPYRKGHYCQDNDDCLQAKKAHKRATEKAWCAVHKPWRARNYEQSSKEAHPSEQPAKVKRYCRYAYCKHKRAPLPEPFRLYHPDCYTRLVEILGRGIDTAYGYTL